MKRENMMFVIMSCMCCLLMFTIMARAEDAEEVATQLSKELRQSGLVNRQDAETIKNPLKDMVAQGASKKDLKNAVTELANKGVKGADLKQSVDSMRDLVKEGKAPREACSVVSQAVAQAHQQGLKGKELAARVHEAIQQSRPKLKKDQAAEEAERARKEAVSRTNKIEKVDLEKDKNKKAK